MLFYLIRRSLQIAADANVPIREMSSCNAACIRNRGASSHGGWS